MRLVYKAVIFFIPYSVILLLLSSCTNNVSEKNERKSDYGNINQESTTAVSKSTTAEDEAFPTSELDTYTTSSNQTDSVDTTWKTIPQLKQAISNVFDAENSVCDIEQKSADLMDRNMICAYLYHTQVLFHYEQPSDEDGYYPAKFLLFQNFEEYESFIRATYVKETADSLLYGFEEKSPVFTEKNGDVLYNPNNMGFTVGPYFYTGYMIKNFSQEDTVCNFIYAPLLNDRFTEKEYNELCQSWGETFEYTCQMVLEDGEWKLSELTGAF